MKKNMCDDFTPFHFASPYLNITVLLHIVIYLDDIADAGGFRTRNAHIRI